MALQPTREPADEIYPSQILDEVRDDLGLAIAIPCYREETVVPLLENLAHCTKPSVNVEVILVIVTSDQDSEQVIQGNQQIYWEAESWYNCHTSLPFSLHILHFQGVPHEIMGVDLARKIGMDEGAARLMAARQPQGVLATLDADAEVSGNYFKALVDTYQTQFGTVALSAPVGFRLPENATEHQKQLVQWVSLEQAYLQQGSIRAGYPLAPFNQASGLSCQAWAYRQVNGLPLEQGNGPEVLWQKLALVGQARPFPNVTISVQSRFLARRPGGLGERLERLSKQGITTYKVVEFRAFEMLSSVMEFGREFHGLHTMRQFQKALEQLPHPARAILIQEHVHQLWRQWHTTQTGQVNSWPAWLQWFDRSRWMRSLHFWGTESLAKIAVEEATAEWLQSISGCEEESLHPEYLLGRLHQMDQPTEPVAYQRRA